MTTWTEIDDLFIKSSEESPEYQHLLKSKGLEEMIRRKKFLGID